MSESKVFKTFDIIVTIDHELHEITMANYRLFQAQLDLQQSEEEFNQALFKHILREQDLYKTKIEFAQSKLRLRLNKNNEL